MGVDEIIGGGRLVLVSEERRDANMVSQPTIVGCEHTDWYISISGIYPWVLGLPFQNRMYWIGIASLIRELLCIILELMDLTWIQLCGIRLLSVHDCELGWGATRGRGSVLGNLGTGSVLIQTSLLNFLPFVSSDRSSCNDDGLLYIQNHNFFRFSLSPLMQLMLQVSL